MSTSVWMAGGSLEKPAEADARHAELAHLQDVVLPGLALREERLLDAIEAGAIDREQAKKRGHAIRDERGVAEAKRDELLTGQRNEIADTEQATTMASNWNGWAAQMEAEMQREESALSRQILAKALAGSPIYVLPGQERRSWRFLGLASYEGVIRGAVRPGAIATFARTNMIQPPWATEMRCPCPPDSGSPTLPSLSPARRCRRSCS
jgi:hypothetical protein